VFGSITPFSVALSAATVVAAFVVNGLFIDVFEASKVAAIFWMILGLNLAALSFPHTRESN